MRVCRVRHLFPSQFINVFQGSSCAVPFGIIMLQNSNFLVDSRWAVEVSALKKERPCKYSTNHTKQPFRGVKDSFGDSQWLLRFNFQSFYIFKIDRRIIRTANNQGYIYFIRSNEAPPFSTVHKWQQNRFNHQTDERICTVRGITTRNLLLPWEITPHTINAGVNPVRWSRWQIDSRHLLFFLLTNSRPSLLPEILSFLPRFT